MEDKSKCGNCGKVWDDSQLAEIRHLWERVSPGEPFPSGECPECGALCQPVSEAEIEASDAHVVNAENVCTLCGMIEPEGACPSITRIPPAVEAERASGATILEKCFEELSALSDQWSKNELADGFFALPYELHELLHDVAGHVGGEKDTRSKELAEALGLVETLGEYLLEAHDSELNDCHGGDCEHLGEAPECCSYCNAIDNARLLLEAHGRTLLKAV